MDDYQLQIDIIKNGAWIDSCPREMLEFARVVYPEEAGYRYVRRNPIDRRSVERTPTTDRRHPE